MSLGSDILLNALSYFPFHGSNVMFCFIIISFGTHFCGDGHS